MSPCSSDYIFTNEEVVGVWRVVSEDSDYFGTWLTVIHGLGDLDHLDQTLTGQMRARLHQPQTFRELQEVTLLGSSQRIPLEERDDRVNQITPSSYTVPMHMFFVVVVTPIDIDITNSEEPHEIVETAQALSTLRHRKLMRHLESGLITPPIVSMRLSNEVD
jgi:hypothetical protein